MADDSEKPSETFTERFNHLTAGIRDAELMTILGLSLSPLNKIRTGETQTLKLHAGLRLAKRVGVSPAYLAFGKEIVEMPGGDDRAHDELVAKVADLEKKFSALIAVVESVTAPDPKPEATRSKPRRVRRES